MVYILYMENKRKYLVNVYKIYFLLIMIKGAFRTYWFYGKTVDFNQDFEWSNNCEQPSNNKSTLCVCH